MKMAVISTWDLKVIKRDLRLAFLKCSQRGLLHSTKWAAELCFALSNVQDEEDDTLSIKPEYASEYDQYILAKSYFDLREYDRAAHFTANCQSPQAKFLHWYSRYQSGEKKKLDDAVDPIAPAEKAKNSVLKTLRVEFEKEHVDKKLDGYCLYLYGVVLKRLQLHSKALEVLREAIHLEPSHWGAWLELAALVTDREALKRLSLPAHWMYEFFKAHTCLELQLNEEALDIYIDLKDHGFQSSTYIMAQVAIAYHNMRDVDQAILGFQVLQKADPFRLDNMDIYSNLLYVKELRVELSYLAHHSCEIDKYRVETCCVIGNFYSLRSQHEKAVLYFQRALRLNPNYLAAWTLMGHEYMEMKNTSAAIQSYRQAIEVNRRDYRAWYGLGQTYEILKMPFYCLYYYRQAQQLRPNDSRMMVALGEAYEKLDKHLEAKKCFWKAHAVGDIEGIALIKLAKCYEKLDEDDQAAATYKDYIAEAETRGVIDRDDKSCAYKFMANYAFVKGQLDEAHEYAQKCTEYPDTREEGKSLIKQIALARSNQEKAKNDSVQMDVTPDIASPINLSFTS